MKTKVMLSFRVPCASAETRTKMCFSLISITHEKAKAGEINQLIKVGFKPKIVQFWKKY